MALLADFLLCVASPGYQSAEAKTAVTEGSATILTAILLLEEGELDSTAVAPALHSSSRRCRIGRLASHQRRVGLSDPQVVQPSPTRPSALSRGGPARRILTLHSPRRGGSGVGHAGSCSSFSAARSSTASQTRIGRHHPRRLSALLGRLGASKPRAHAHAQTPGSCSINSSLD